MRRLRHILLALACVALPGCYEGWDYDEKSGNGDPTPPPPPIPSIPPFFYILLEPIYLAADAIDDDDCFAESGISDFRKAEWDQRVATLTAALQPLAQNFQVAPHLVAKDDCEKLSTVRFASINPRPWAPADEPGDDPLDRGLINVRAVFWEGDVELDPPTVVTAENWVAFETMRKSGRRAKTLNHFVLEHEGEGYFHSWHAGLAAEARVDGTKIDDVDPTDTGIAARAAIIQTDATRVVQWLTENP